MGDCAENFQECTKEMVDKKINQINMIANLIENNTNKKVVKIGRIAGQFAKPRSMAYETIQDKSVFTFRGEIINGLNSDER
jgi:3-deoxy-7-phosphoheptulonate synthase